MIILTISKVRKTTEGESASVSETVDAEEGNPSTSHRPQRTTEGILPVRFRDSVSNHYPISIINNS